jgi:hypothetical protein
LKRATFDLGYGLASLVVRVGRGSIGHQSKLPSTTRRSSSVLFRFAKLRFDIQFQNDFAPADFLGSRLRGGYGFGLLAQLCRRDYLLSCARQPQLCECDYLRLFRPRRDSSKVNPVGAPLGNQQNLPATFALDPPDARNRPYQAGERMLFDFVAIGPMCDYLPQSIKAFEEFGKVGLILDSLHRARFRLVAVNDVLDSGRSVYESEKLVSHLSLDISQAVSEATEPGNEILITFCTPTRIENQNARCKDRETGLAIFSDFYDLIYNTAHRVAGLWQLYGENWHGPVEFFRWRERLLKLSRQITTIQSDLKMMRLCGYSNMQEAPKPLDGFIGSMRFSGDFSPFMELLRIAEIVHIGSETTCGLGQFCIVET